MGTLYHVRNISITEENNVIFQNAEIFGSSIYVHGKITLGCWTTFMLIIGQHDSQIFM